MKKALFTFFILLTWLAGFTIFAHRINHYTIDTNTQTEAIIALTGGRYRIAEAVKLLNQGKAQKLFISGVSPNNSLEDIITKQNLHLNSTQKVSIGRQAQDTIGNAQATVTWLKKNNINSIRLVTSNYHVDRSLAEFREQAPNLKIIPHPVYSDKVAKKWWTSWHSFSLLFKEYNKFLYAYIRCNFFSRGN